MPQDASAGRRIVGGQRASEPIPWHVNVYLSSSWRSKFNSPHEKAREVLAHASKIFLDDSLDIKILLKPHYIELDQDHPLTAPGIRTWQKNIPSQYLRTGTLHMLLTDGNGPVVVNSIFIQSSICDKNNR